MAREPSSASAGPAAKASRQSLSRTLAVVLGGYGFTATITALLAIALPMPRPEATTAATLLSIFIYVAAALWAFGTRSAARAWLVLGGTSLIGLIIAATRGILA